MMNGRPASTAVPGAASAVEPGRDAPPTLPVTEPDERARLERRARRLALWSGVWHLIEFAVALAAGIMAGSIALVAFGMDSVIEFASGGVIVWLFTGGRGQSERAERLAQRLIGTSFFLLAAYVAVEAGLSLIGGERPEVSWLGIALAAVTAPTMPLLALAKRRLGRALGSPATTREGEQNQICAYLSVALLAGLLLNALAGVWWADPLAALAIAAVAVNEGVEGWRGEE